MLAQASKVTAPAAARLPAAAAARAAAAQGPLYFYLVRLSTLKGACLPSLTLSLSTPPRGPLQTGLSPQNRPYFFGLDYLSSTWALEAEHSPRLFDKMAGLLEQ